MEPPSPIVKLSGTEADAMSDDPLSNCVFMILDSESGPEEGNVIHYVCAYTVRTGLLYIGMTGNTIS